MRHTAAIFAALTLGAVTACGSGAAPDTGLDSSSTDPIRIGLIVSLTGSSAPLGGEDEKAVELAVDQLNAAGGVLGRKVEILVRDDRTRPEEAVLGFNDIKDMDVAGVIGPVLSTAALEVGPMAQQEKIPYLSLSPTSEQLKPLKSYVFVAPALASAYAERYLRYFESRKITKLALAHDTTSAYAVAGNTASRELAAKYGVRVVADESFETATTDFGPLLSRVGSADAGAFLFWGTGAPAITLTRQYATSGVEAPLMLTGAQASPLWLDPVGGEGAEGVTVASGIGVVGDHLPAGPQKQVIDRLAGPYEQLHGHAPPQFAYDAYSAALLLFEAIKKAGSTDGEKIQRALESMDLRTPNGRYRFSPADHSGLSPDYISVNTVRGGRFVPTGWAGERLAEVLDAD